MSSIKATWFFEDGTYGWSESLWQSGGPVTIAQVLADAVAIAPKRMALMGAGPSMTYIRVSDENVLRDSLVNANQIISQNLFDQAGKPDTPPGVKYMPPAILGDGGVGFSPNADVPYSALLVRMESGSLYRRLMYLRGIPDDIITDRTGPLKPKSWFDAFNAWSKAVQVTWSFRVLSKDPLVAPVKTIPANGITPVAGSPATIACVGHGLALLDKIRFYGGTGTNLPKGVYTVTPLDLNSFQAIGYSPAVGSVTYAGGLKFVKQSPTYTNIDNVFIRGETHRVTGRPFGSPRGRRLAKA